MKEEEGKEKKKKERYLVSEYSFVPGTGVLYKYTPTLFFRSYGMGERECMDVGSYYFSGGWVPTRLWVLWVLWVLWIMCFYWTLFHRKKTLEGETRGFD